LCLGDDSDDILAFARKQLGKLRFDRAMIEVDRVLETDPGNLDAWRLRGEIALAQGDLDDALDSWTIASRLAPQDAELLVHIGDLLIRKPDQLDAALDAYARVLALDPGNTRVMTSVGSIHERRQRWAEAATSYEAALAVDPNLLRARSSLGAVKFKMGDYQGASEALTKAIELSPNDLRSRIYFGLSQNHMGHYDVAIRELKEAVQIDPHAANQLIGLRGQHGQFMHLVEVFTPPYELNPREAGRSYDLAVIYFFARDYEKSWEFLAKAEYLRYPVPMTFKEVVYSKRRLQRAGA
jgi:tetratricopeptide (TPR) repeat protein